MIERTIVVTPSTEELAEAFSALPADEQARFFWRVAQIWKAWGPYERDSQIFEVSHHLRLEYPEALQLLDELSSEYV